MVELKDLMSTTQKSLAETQLIALKAHAINVLGALVTHIENDEFDGVTDFMTYSPAGDGNGTDHNFIDFKYDGNKKSDGVDLLELCWIMQNLYDKKEGD